MNRTRKDRVEIVSAHGQIEGSEEHKPISLDRAGGHTRSVMAADVQERVAENLHARRAATGIIAKINGAPSASARAAVGNQRGVARGRVSEKADKWEPARVDEPSIAGGRVIVEFHTATAVPAARTDGVGNTRIARAGAVEELCDAAWIITGLGAAVSDASPIPRGRAVCELYRSMLCAVDIGHSHKILRDP